ncbi:complement factor B, partial [Carettochelys insculpta]|uniref:complement factor B n=1 Tax=Carettochelys insculpta TaxID=44489 RepID=UPI003EC02A08
QTTYDTPREVSAAFLASLSETAEEAESNRTGSEKSKRRIRIEAGGSMNIYLVLDASDSVGEGNFTQARDALVQLVEKISSYGVFPHYAILTFATEPHVVLSALAPRSSDADFVTTQLEKLQYKSHAQRSGTNTRAALTALYNMMVQQEREELQRGHKVAPVANSTRHVLLLMTDGNTNMGGSPEPVVAQIRELLSINRGREDYLDIYVFGIGALVNLQNLNALATHKSNEKHVFHMQNIQDLRKTFQEMIDESEVLSMCGLGYDYQEASDQQKHPWHVAIKIARPGKGQEICKGSLISPYYVLTAAHCFDINDEAQWISVDVGPQLVNKVEELQSHPQYHIGALRDKGIPEFYDYDVALVKLKKPVPFSPTVRPICLPCTEGATRALRKPHPETSCQHHERLLLPAGEVPALFVHEKVDRQRRKVLERKEVHIKNGPKKSACEADAKKALIYVNVTDVSQVVTPRFFCSGGIDPVVDPNTCKGDSGGPLIIHKGKRYFQVGVISWGVVDVCKDPQQQSPPYARDFHLNLFTVLPWLRKELAKEELGFM